jgi:multiple sugar transport system permease protein
MSIKSPMKRSSHGQKSLLTPRSKTANTLMIFGIGYFMMPLIWVILASTKSKPDLFSTFSLWFGHSFKLFDNLHSLFTQDGGLYLIWIKNTAIYSISSALGATLISAMAGYSLARFKFKGVVFLESMVLGLIMVPATALVMPLYLMFAKVNVVNTPWAVILPSLLNPFAAFLIRVYVLESIPEELIQAARIDRAGEFRIFWQIVLPMLRPALVTVFLFSLVASWNNFFLPLVMLSENHLYPVTVGLQAWFAQASQESGNSVLYNLVITGALVAVLPLIISFLFLQRYWRGGINAGAVK